MLHSITTPNNVLPVTAYVLPYECYSLWLCLMSCCFAGDQVNCQLNITSSRLLPHHAARISFCLLTPNDLEKKHVFALVDSVSNRSPANFRRPRVMPQSSHRGGERDGAGEPKLPAMNVLNQEVLSATPTHYG